MRHLYLFTLEIDPLGIGKVYNELPSHVTLMSRFLSEMACAELASSVQHVFRRARPIVLAFDETRELGPKKTLAHMVDSPAEITLHNELYQFLSALGVEFQYPQFIGSGHKAHVSKRENATFEKGQIRVSSAAYLIEVVDAKRIPRAKIDITIQ